MSTPRTRHQQRNSSAAQQPKPSNSLPKKLGSIIAASLLLCITLSAMAKLLPIELPNHTISSILIFTIFLLIYTVIKFIVNQYRTLQNTYRNIEQGMREGMMYGGQQIDYVEYPQYNQQPYPQQNYPQYNQQAYPQQIPQVQQSSSAAQNRRQRRRNKKFPLALGIVTILIVSVSGFITYQLWGMTQEVERNEGVNIYIYECVESKITDISVNEFEVYDEDAPGGSTTQQNYVFDAVYNYGGEEHKIHSNTNSLSPKLSVGDTVYIYINPNEPESEILTSFTLSEKILSVTGTFAGISFLISVLLIQKLLRYIISSLF